MHFLKTTAAMVPVVVVLLEKLHSVGNLSFALHQNIYEIGEEEDEFEEGGRRTQTLLRA